MGSEQPNRPRARRRRSRGHAPDATPVVRLDIYASSEGATAKQAQAPGAPAPQINAEADGRSTGLDERERALAAREVELDRADGALVARARALDDHEGALEAREAALASREVELERSESALVHRMRGLDDREGALAEREAAVAQAHDAEIALADVERRRRRLAAQEESLTERTLELERLEQQAEERETLVAEREAHVRLELDLREDELEGREKAVADQEERLVRKERDLTTYVGQLQGRLTVVK